MPKFYDLQMDNSPTLEDNRVPPPHISHCGQHRERDRSPYCTKPFDSVVPGILRLTAFLRPATCPLPFSCLHKFLNLSLNQIPLQRTDMGNIKLPMQVIRLVQKRPGQ
jgi:hypothetical protein